MTATMAADPAGAGDRALAAYVRRTVYPYSAYYRSVLDQAGVGDRLRDRTQLGRVPPTDLSLIPDPGQLVLRPDLSTIVRRGRRTLAVRAVTAKAAGGMHGFNRRVLEHRFKPVHWVLAEGVPIGYSAADLQTLARAGAAWLELSGVSPRDVVVDVLGAGPNVGYWQLVGGCRRARVSAVHLDPHTDPAMVERLGPSVLVGDPQHLVALLATARQSGHPLAHLRTVIAVGDPLGSDLRRRLQALGSGAVVVGAWAPPGVRALWSECRAGAERSDPTGYHTGPDDVLELAPGPAGAAGELLWTGVGWHGSALLRLRTFTTVSVEGGSCPACGRRSRRVVPLAPVPRGTARPAVTAGRPHPTALPALVEPAPAEPLSDPIATTQVPVVASDPSGTGLNGAAAAGAEAVLDAEADVAAWQVEYRTVDGRSETIVVLAPAWGAAVVPLIRRLDRHLGAAQFVVLPIDEVTARIDSAGSRFVSGEAR